MSRRFVAVSPALLLTAVATLAALLVAPQATAAPKWAKPVSLSQARADSMLALYEKDRTETRKWLETAETSYLAAISRRDFEDKTTLTVGRDPDQDLRIDDPEFAPKHLRVTVDGDSFHVEAVDKGATFRIRNQRVREATLGPSRIDVGRFGLRLSHQRFPGIIVYDPKSPRFAEYKGIDYFPADLAYRFELPLRKNARPDTVIILSTRGNQRRALHVGWFDFVIAGKNCTLEAHRLLEPGVGEGDFGLFFKDATCGAESYEMGRYVEVGKLIDGRYVLDFNFTYNPACAYSLHYNCPIPPKANVLSVAIRAGEKDLHYLGH